MSTNFLLYGSYGFLGDAIARRAVERGLQPILAGRDAAKVDARATELGLDCRVFSLDDTIALEAALRDAAVVLHCAGPFRHTFQPMVEACLRTGTHYLDITGEIPVFQAIAARDTEAREKGVMLLPAAGFDVVPSDCLAVHLKQRLPSATHLMLAFRHYGPARLPPGTARTMLETIPYSGITVRRDGRLVQVPWGRTRMVDFGRGPRQSTLLTWGDVFMAYHSTGIPNIEVYTAIPKTIRRMLGMLQFLRPLFRLAAVRNAVWHFLPVGSTPEQRAKTSAIIWGEVKDDQGRRAASRLHGPEAGVDWTSIAALDVVQKVLGGDAPVGFQTPAMAYGPDFVLEGEGVIREDLD